MKASSMSLSCHAVGRPLHRVGHETVRVCGRLLGETCHHRLNPTSLSEATLVVVASCPSGAEFSTVLHVPVTSSWCWSVVPTGSVLSCRMWTGTWSLGHCVCTTHSMHGNHFVWCAPCAASFFFARAPGRPPLSPLSRIHIMSNAVSSTGTHGYLLGVQYRNMVNFKRSRLTPFLSSRTSGG